MIERSLRVLAATEKKVQRFLAVAHHEDTICHLPPLQGMEGKIHVVLIVFYQQYVQTFQVHD
jgi:hypothetical protein